MRTRKSYRRAFALVAVAIAIVGLLAAGALAQSTNPNQPVMLQNNVPASATLTGSNAGAFHYYAIEYPGDLRVVTIEMNFVPSDPVTRLGVGFKVYGPDGFFIGEGERPEDGDGALLQLRYSDSRRATWLIQVYNYLPGPTISYALVAKGLPAPTPVPATPTPGGTPAPPTQIVETETGALTGSHAGAYDFYQFSYPGDGSTVTVTMTYFPGDPVIALGANFIVYGPSGEVARGERMGVVNQLTAGFASSVPGTYLIQVYNYIIDGVTIQYALRRQVTAS